MHGARPLTRLVLVLALGLFGLAGAESEPESAAGPAASPSATEAAAAAAGQASPQVPAEPDPAQIDTWLAAGRALKAERPELFGRAEGVLATQVLADGQGAGAGIVPEIEGMGAIIQRQSHPYSWAPFMLMGNWL